MEQEAETERSRSTAQLRAAREEAEGLRQQLEEAEERWAESQKVSGPDMASGNGAEGGRMAPRDTGKEGCFFSLSQ